MVRRRLADALRNWRRRDPERELNDELAFHFERTVGELTSAGWSREDATREAERRFGDVRRYRRELSSLDRSTAARVRVLVWLAELVDDVRHAARGVRRSPGIAAAVMLMFGLGIGANATMYGILDRILLSPPAHISEPESVKRLLIDEAVSYMPERIVVETMTYPDYEDLLAARSFVAVAAFSPYEPVLGSGADAERLHTLIATGSYFSTLGVRPALGRLFGPDDDRLGAQPVAVISHALWQRRFGGAANVIGQQLDLDRYSSTIIGVAPRGFTGTDLSPIDVWQPVLTVAPLLFEGDEWRVTRGWHMFSAVARLAGDITAEAAQLEATGLHRAAYADATSPGDDDDARVVVASLIRARGPGAPGEAAVARWLGGVSLLLLIVVCANVANLLLARSARQERETAVRLALGISRSRLLRQVTLGAVILALLGAAAAVGVTFVGGAALREVLLPGVSWQDPATVRRVLLFTGITALIVGALTGAAPGVQSLRVGMLSALSGGGRGSTRTRSRTRSGLIVVQAAVSVVLLIGAGLFVRSLLHATSLDLGFEPDGMITVDPVLDGSLQPDERRAFFQRAEAVLAAVPGVTGVTFATTAPFHDLRMGYSLRIPGLDSIPSLSTGAPKLNAVDADYFQVLRQRLVRGRGFTRADEIPGAAPVALINETMARHIPWPGGDAIGNCMRLGSSTERPCIPIVGVVGNARANSLVEEETMQYYVASGSGVVPMVPNALLLRTGLASDDIIPAVRQALHAAEPALRYVAIRPLAELVEPDLRAWKLGATMFSIFGVLALLVAALGLYSVLAFTVAERHRELGVRSALGADAHALVMLVLRAALTTSSVGVGLGVLVALATAPKIAGLLYDVSPRDPFVILVVGATLLGTAVVASLLPAAQAARTDPQTALRAE